MAIVTTTIVAPVLVQPYTGLPASVLERSAAPRADVIFKDNGVEVTAGGAGNTQRLAVACNLPQNFSYGFAEFHFSISTPTGSVNNWEANGLSIIVDAAAGRTSFINSPLFNRGVADSFSLPTRDYQIESKFSGILLPPANTSGAKMAITLANLTENMPAGTLNYYIRFYQFDVEQAYHYRLNSPQLIR